MTSPAAPQLRVGPHADPDRYALASVESGDAVRGARWNAVDTRDGSEVVVRVFPAGSALPSDTDVPGLAPALDRFVGRPPHRAHEPAAAGAYAPAEHAMVVTEVLDAPTLTEWLATEPLRTESQCRRMIERLRSALDHHPHGAVNGDHVLLAAEGPVLIEHVGWLPAAVFEDATADDDRAGVDALESLLLNGARPDGPGREGPGPGRRRAPIMLAAAAVLGLLSAGAAFLGGERSTSEGAVHELGGERVAVGAALPESLMPSLPVSAAAAVPGTGESGDVGPTGPIGSIGSGLAMVETTDAPAPPGEVADSTLRSPAAPPDAGAPDAAETPTPASVAGHTAGSPAVGSSDTTTSSTSPPVPGASTPPTAPPESIANSGHSGAADAVANPAPMPTTAEPTGEASPPDAAQPPTDTEPAADPSTTDDAPTTPHIVDGVFATPLPDDFS